MKTKSRKETTKKQPAKSGQKKSSRASRADNKPAKKAEEKPAMEKKKTGRGNLPAKPKTAAPAAAKSTRTEKAKSAARKAKQTMKRAAAVPAVAGVLGTMTEAGIGAASSVSLQFAWTKLPASVPAALRTGTTARLSRIAVGFGSAWLAKKVIGKKHATSIARGVATVELAELMKEGLNKVLSKSNAEAGVDGLGEIYEVADGVWFDRVSGAYLDRDGNLVDTADARLNGVIFYEDEAAA